MLSNLRKSLEYDAEFPDALLSLAEIAYLKEEYLTASAFLQRYEAVGPMSAESLMLGYRISVDRNNESQATRYRNLVLQRFPNSAQAQALQGSRRQ